MDDQVNGSRPSLEEAQELARTRLRELHPELFLGGEEDPLVALGEIAELHGVGYQTTLQWRQRSKPEYDGKGKIENPFPDDEPPQRAHAPRFRLSKVVAWAYGERKWPEQIARPSTRGPRSAAA